MVEWRDSLEYRWSTWSTSSSCVLERSREVTMVARVHVASKYYIQTMLSLGRCLSTTNISYAIIRCTVPRRWARPGVQGCWEHILSTLYATCAYLVGWNGLSVFTLDDKVLHFGSSSIELCTSPYSITTYWRTYRFQLTLSPLLRSPAVELTLNGIHNNFPQSYTTSSYAPSRSKTSPRNLEWLDFTRLFLLLKIPRD